MAITWTNGVVTLTKDLVFGLSVLSDKGWIPLYECDKQEVDLIKKLVDNNPSFPKNWEWPTN